MEPYDVNDIEDFEDINENSDLTENEKEENDLIENEKDQLHRITLKDYLKI